ncbi:hypothetical protein [Neorhizobium sp. NCHU2750]|uniref:hypothetical protein n=1 Tax=Neorhizobium sp. NCHU2750 TaxID=1825976 RepID=UPI000E720952|nr:hypothetical protein NCHU2750_26600 [Neorhizobium sp. NCHU2750]
MTSQKQYSSDGTKIGILDDQGTETVISFDEFCSRLGVDGWVRLHGSDYSGLAALATELVHFNLGVTDNAVGRRYAMVEILRPGKRLADGGEQLPVVDISRYRLADCIEVIQHLPLDDITAEQLRHSLPSIRSKAEVRKALIARYRPMLPKASEDDLLAHGIALSRFSFI